MKPVYLAHEIAQMDQYAVSQGVAIEGLIGAAGNAIADMILKSYPACSVLLFCGPGHNGADGLATARLLAPTHGVTVLQFLPDKMKEPTRIHRQRLEQTRVRIVDIEDGESLSKTLEKLNEPTVVVDALLGTGSSGAPRGVLADAIDAINAYAQTAEVIAIDIPTGVMVDSGNVHEKAAKVHHTIALMGYKPAHLLYPAAQYAGRLRLVVPFALAYRPAHETFWFQSEDIQPILRQRGTHKGHYGCLLIAAGSRGYSGAGEMCTRAALRSGCGTLVICAPASTVCIYRQKMTEAMTFELPETAQGSYDACEEEFQTVLPRADACVAGPGMGDGPGVMDIVRAMIQSELPVVLDADALNALAREGKDVLHETDKAILTPHPGELARLLDVGIEEILRDPIGHANQMAQTYGCICMLKMASTIIASPQRTAITTTGCAGMAKGGSGDVLAGCLGAMLAQGLKPFYAACFAAHACGQAGQLAQRHWGMTSMLPTDTIVQLPRVFKKYET